MLLTPRFGDPFDAICTGAADKGTWVRIFHQLDIWGMRGVIRKYHKVHLLFPGNFMKTMRAFWKLTNCLPTAFGTLSHKKSVYSSAPLGASTTELSGMSFPQYLHPCFSPYQLCPKRTIFLSLPSIIFLQPNPHYILQSPQQWIPARERVKEIGRKIQSLIAP